jgi:phosphoribosylformimino-5-aminoimidazole carboxamide ribotide isomerase
MSGCAPSGRASSASRPDCRDLTRFVCELLIEGGGVVRRRLPPGARGRLVASDPVAYARELAHQGVGVFALVDLDGWSAGSPQAVDLARTIVDATGLELWYRGGLIAPGAAEEVQASGASLLVLESLVLRDAAFLRYALDTFGDQVAVAIDASGARVPSPFADGTELSLPDAAGELAFRGVERLVVSDTARAGTLAGPNLTALRRLLDAVPCSVSYGGGVASLDDLRALRDLGRATLQAVLVATALAEGRFTPAGAVAIMEQGA